MNPDRPIVEYEDPEEYDNDPGPLPRATLPLVEYGDSPFTIGYSPWSNWYATPGLMITSSQQGSPHCSPQTVIGTSHSPHITWSASPGMTPTMSQIETQIFMPPHTSGNIPSHLSGVSDWSGTPEMMITTSQTTSPRLIPPMTPQRDIQPIHEQSGTHSLAGLRNSTSALDRLGAGDIVSLPHLSSSIIPAAGSMSFLPSSLAHHSNQSGVDGSPATRPLARSETIIRGQNVHFDPYTFSGFHAGLRGESVTLWWPNNFPRETLANIFMFFAEELAFISTTGTSERLETLLLVNHEWNFVAAHYSPLWWRFSLALGPLTDFEALSRLLKTRGTRLGYHPRIEVDITITKWSREIEPIIGIIAGPEQALIRRWLTLNVVSIVDEGAYQLLNEILASNLENLRQLRLHYRSYLSQHTLAPPAIFTINKTCLETVSLNGCLLSPPQVYATLEKLTIKGVTHGNYLTDVDFTMLQIMCTDASASLPLQLPVLRRLEVISPIGHELVSFFQVSHIITDNISYIRFLYDRQTKIYADLPSQDDLKQQIYAFLAQNNRLAYVEGPIDVIALILTWRYESQLQTQAWRLLPSHPLMVSQAYSRLTLQPVKVVNSIPSQAPSQAPFVLTGNESGEQLDQIARRHLSRTLPIWKDDRVRRLFH